MLLNYVAVAIDVKTYTSEYNKLSPWSKKYQSRNTIRHCGRVAKALARHLAIGWRRIFLKVCWRRAQSSLHEHAALILDETNKFQSSRLCFLVRFRQKGKNLAAAELLKSQFQLTLINLSANCCTNENILKWWLSVAVLIKFAYEVIRKETD